MKYLILLFPIILFSQEGFNKYNSFSNFLPSDDGYTATNSEATALYSRMTTQPDNTRKELIDNTIGRLKSNNIWSLLDVMYVFAAHEESAAYLNWVEDANNGTASGTYTFTADQGWQSNGTSGYINTNYNPNTDATNLELDDAMYGIYSRTNKQNNNMVDFGGYVDVGVGVVSCVLRTTIDNIGYYMHTTGSQSDPNTNSAGFITIERTASDLTTTYRDGSKLGDETDASAAIPNCDMYISARNNTGTGPGNYSDREYSAFIIGEAIGATLQDSLNSIIEDYMDALGVGVQ